MLSAQFKQRIPPLILMLIRLKLSFMAAAGYE
jgi:hypothetical protein